MTENQPEIEDDREPIDVPDVLTACVVLFMVIGLAVVEVGWLASLIAIPAPDWKDRAELYINCGVIGLLWLICLRVEWFHRYSPSRARKVRRAGWTIQLIFIIAITATGWPRGQHYDGAVLASLDLSVLPAWSLWIRSFALHPNDQADIDEMLAEEDDRIAETREAAAILSQDARKSRAMKHLGLPAPAKDEQATPKLPVFPWPIPKGKHEPLVYFIQNGSRVKIGTTTGLRSRISSLSLRASDVVLLLAGDRIVEQSMHRRFARYRVGNTEWFELTGGLADAITELHEQAFSAAKQGV